MSATIPNKSRLFSSAPPDEATEIEALARALEWAEGYKLIFVRCNLPEQRQRVLAALRERLPNLSAQDIRLQEPISHLLDYLRVHLTEPFPAVVFVSGLEYSLPVAETADQMPFVANLNAARNSFGGVIRCPLVLFVPDYVLKAIMRGAPDFFSIRSGAYYFSGHSSETQQYFELLTFGDDSYTENILMPDKVLIVSSLQSLLDEYASLPADQQDKRAELRIRQRLSNIYWHLGHWTKAEEECHKAIKLADEMQDKAQKAFTLETLGNVLARQHHWQKALQAYNEALPILEQHNPLNGAKLLEEIGTLYVLQSDWETAEGYYDRALAAYCLVGKLAEADYILANMGWIMIEQQRWDEAEQHFKIALSSFNNKLDLANIAKSYNSLGIIYSHQGRIAEAEATLRQGISLNQSLGDLVGEGQGWGNLANLYIEQGWLSKAADCVQQAIKAFEKTEDAVNLKKARSHLSEIEEQLCREEIQQ